MDLPLPTTNSSFMAWVIMQIQSQNYTNISVIHLDQDEQNTITFPIFVLGCQASVAWPFTRSGCYKKLIVHKENLSKLIHKPLGKLEINRVVDL